MAAGFLSLINGDFGRLLMLIEVVYAINGVAWALLDAFITPILPKTDKSSRKK